MDREIAIGLGTGNRSSATAASQSCTKYFALIGSEILNPKVVAEEAKRVIPKFHLHDFDAQQGRETERLCRIDNGAGDILSSEPQTVDSGTSQIRAAQFRLTHLHISEQLHIRICKQLTAIDEISSSSGRSGARSASSCLREDSFSSSCASFPTHHTVLLLLNASRPSVSNHEHPIN